MSPSKLELDLADVFEMGPSWATRYCWAQVDFPMERVNALARGEFVPDEPVALEISSGTQAADFIWNSHILAVASSRVVDILRRARFTGWKTFPVRIERRQQEISGYDGLAITGRAGEIDEVKSRVRWSDPDEQGRRAILGMRGLYFDTAKWDGSDFFIVGQGISAEVTRRVVERFRHERVTNCRFTPVREVEFGEVD